MTGNVLPPPFRCSILRADCSRNLDVAGLLRPVNAVLAPFIKAGFANPIGFSVGLVVLEVRGRKTGLRRSTPLTCLALGSTVIVATVRETSQWLQNLAAAGEAQLWLRGRRRPAQARIVAAGQLGQGGTEMPPPDRVLWRLLRRLTRSGVVNVAVLDLH